MNARICKMCGGPLGRTQIFLCLACMMGEPEPEQPEEHPQSEWKQEVANDDVVLRKVWEK